MSPSYASMTKLDQDRRWNSKLVYKMTERGVGTFTAGCRSRSVAAFITTVTAIVCRNTILHQQLSVTVATLNTTILTCSYFYVCSDFLLTARIRDVKSTRATREVHLSLKVSFCFQYMYTSLNLRDQLINQELFRFTRSTNHNSCLFCLGTFYTQYIVEQYGISPLLVRLFYLLFFFKPITQFQGFDFIKCLESLLRYCYKRPIVLFRDSK